MYSYIKLDTLRATFSYDPKLGTLFKRGYGMIDLKGPNMKPYVRFNGRRIKILNLCYTLYFGKWPTCDVYQINNEPGVLDIRLSNLGIG